MTNSKNIAKQYFYKKEYNKALEIFIKENDNYSTGLCYLLLKDEKNARKYWQKNKNISPASQFGLSVLDIIHLKTKTLPTFFQTRAHLEVYLNLFLENKLYEWAENIISCCDFFYKANPESYKFISRALFANGFFDIAITFAKKTLQLFYYDPEALLILSQCYFLKNEMGEALDCVNKTLDIVPDYFPAILFNKIIREEIEKRRIEKNKLKKDEI